MSINGIPGAGKATLQLAAQPSAAASPTASRDAASALTPEVDEVTNQPLPPRFPWLSRLSHQLEKASNQPSPFAPAPLLGDHLDRSV